MIKTGGNYSAGRGRRKSPKGYCEAIFLLAIVCIFAWGMVWAGEYKKQTEVIFDLERLEKLRKESFSDFLLDINERDIFSPPGFEVFEEVFSSEEGVSLPKLEFIYRGKMQIGEKKVAMIEAVKDNLKKNYFLKAGESFGYYKLVDIQNEFVVIRDSQGGQKKLYFSGQ